MPTTAVEATTAAATIANPALTALFISVMYALVRVVLYFISKKNGPEKVVLSDIHAAQLKTMAEDIKILKGNAEVSQKLAQKMQEMHEVYDGNRVPVWYVPAELLTTIRSLNAELTAVNKEVAETMGEIKSGQTVLIDKLGDLINSQRLMTERLGDLIAKLNKLSLN